MESYAIILAGGIGERLWPISRLKMPKQVMKLFSGQTLLRETIERVLPIVPMERIFIVTGKDMGNALREMHPDIPSENYIIEPEGKNTAPAICLATAHITARYGDGLIFVFASDHFIEPAENFRSLLLAAKYVVVTNDKIVLLGIQPTRAETDYGYIQMGELILTYDGIKCMEVKSFTEKPPMHVAGDYYRLGTHLWNSGNFIFRAGKMFEEVEKFLPNLWAGMKKYIDSYDKPEADDIIKNTYCDAPKISIDKSIIEKSQNVVVLRGMIHWDDVGSWNAIPRIVGKDRQNNSQVGPGEVMMLDSYDMTICNTCPGLVVAFGVHDLVVVRMQDVVLLLDKTRIPDMRELVKKLKENEKFNKYL